MLPRAISRPLLRACERFQGTSWMKPSIAFPSRRVVANARPALPSTLCSRAGYSTSSKGDLSDILRNNEAWAKETSEQDPEFFKRLGAGQAPKYLWVGCSDSRVPACQILGLGPGDVFVHRNVANMVVNTDMNLMTVLQYAVAVLKVEHVIVCGHYDCGGVKASLQPTDHGFIENWLRNIRDVHRLHQDELAALPTLEERQNRLVELNVVEQCLNLFKTGVIQQRRLETHKQEGFDFAVPRIHGLVFNPADGSLKKIPVDFKAYIEKHRSVYDLYSKGD